jgi:hypothetical protein
LAAVCLAREREKLELKIKSGVQVHLCACVASSACNFASISRVCCIAQIGENAAALAPIITLGSARVFKACAHFLCTPCEKRIHHSGVLIMRDAATATNTKM